MKESIARPAAAGAILAAALYVYAASDVEFGTHESLRLDKLAYSQTDGYVAEHHGGLLPAGTTTVRLQEGVYHFRAAGDVQFRVGVGGSVVVVSPNDTKGGTPDPPSAPAPFAAHPVLQWAAHTVALSTTGSPSVGPAPTLTVIHA